ncbi:TIGR03087 family PEP-CTERM/XrtA system glycosyltransferase [Neptunomonas sp.]|uniref:TIGR03087 family PEP-CTERM/XrtA system glycosyltransferase n=1 Tax=Neptunomonas sp. TaxID=1971898 RepID=UPI00356848B0
MKPALLLLCHRIPYPPNKGDKIRAYHLLKFLTKHYRVCLGAFVDDPLDWKYVPDLEGICEETFFVKLNPLKAKLKCMKGFVTGDALSVPYYQSNKLQKWVRSTIKTHKIEKAMIVSSVMAQFLADKNLNLSKKIIDIVDIDSDKWQQYSAKKSWPMSWVYRREARTLLAYEKQAVEAFDASLFVSSAEADMFKTKISASQDKIGYYNNGVDSQYFSPFENYSNPFASAIIPLVFTGAMDYWPNIDAVSWFVKEVFPRLRKTHPAIHFYIVGSNPNEEVLKLALTEGVIVTGRVEDIRPYLHFACASVAPMRIARGIQNKVLEAMAMEKTVIVSVMGLEGINAENGLEVVVANTVDEYIKAVNEVLNNSFDNMGAAARQRVKNDFNWAESLPTVMDLLESNNQETQL